eukprot:4662832-Pleurochrysis_carterae.AAC.2
MHAYPIASSTVSNSSEAELPSLSDHVTCEYRRDARALSQLSHEDRESRAKVIFPRRERPRENGRCSAREDSARETRRSDARGRRNR